MDKYTVLRDSQEKDGHGWRFNKTDYCDGTIIRKMKTGDYSLIVFLDNGQTKDMTNIFTIERKGSIGEFARNIVEKRFDRELERMAHIKHSFILLEFNMSKIINYPVGSGIPKSKWKDVKIRGPVILRRMSEIMIQYPNIKIICCGKYGQNMALSLFKRIMAYETK